MGDSDGRRRGAAASRLAVLFLLVHTVGSCGVPGDDSAATGGKAAPSSTSGLVTTTTEVDPLLEPWCESAEQVVSASIRTEEAYDEVIERQDAYEARMTSVQPVMEAIQEAKDALEEGLEAVTDLTNADDAPEEIRDAVRTLSGRMRDAYDPDGAADSDAANAEMVEFAEQRCDVDLQAAFDRVENLPNP